ncbi:MAG: MJ0042-type zinc finger domain-containing protein, partial [Planctomycetota bacterium]
PISAKCDSCSAQFKLKDEFAGKKVKCPKCSKPFMVPSVRKKVAQQPPNDGYGLEPVQPRQAMNPMLDLLDDMGVESTPLGPVCPKCSAELTPGAIICMECGYNMETGKQLETMTFKDPTEVGSGMSDAEQLVAKAEKEMDESPISLDDQNFGDGADSFLIAAVAGIVMLVLAAIGVGTIFLMDKIGEQVNTALISICGSIGIYIACGGWITWVAFKARPGHGLGCLLSGFLYGIVFGFIQGKTLMLPAIICLASILIGIVSTLVYMAGAA